jgi:hypothetical protein
MNTTLLTKSARVTGSLKCPALVAMSLAATAIVSQAALVEVSLTADSSSAALSGHPIGQTLDDTFTYNANDPESTTADVAATGNTYPGFTGANVATTQYLQYTFTAITTTALQNEFHVDVWGRDTVNTAGVAGRDDNFTIALYNGDYVTAVLTSPLSSVDGSPYHERISFTGITSGTTFDRFEISADNKPYFSLAEVRAAYTAVPEPSSTALLGLGGLALILRRHK